MKKNDRYTTIVTFLSLYIYISETSLPIVGIDRIVDLPTYLYPGYY